MAFYLSPLVDVREVDITNTVGAVATSVGALVLRASTKGPEFQTVLVNNEEDLVNIFGVPNEKSYLDFFTASGFLKYSNKLYITRVTPYDPAGDEVVSAGVKAFVNIDGLVITAKTEGIDYNGYTFSVVDAGVGALSMTYTALTKTVVINLPTINTIGQLKLYLYDIANTQLDPIRAIFDFTGVDTDVVTFADIVGTPITSGGVNPVLGLTTNKVANIGISDTGVGASFNPAFTVYDIESKNTDEFSVYNTATSTYMDIIASSSGSWGNDLKVYFCGMTTQKAIITRTFVVPVVEEELEWYNIIRSVDSTLANDKEFLMVVVEKGKVVETFNVSTNTEALDDQGRTKYVDSVIADNSRYIKTILNANAVDVVFDTDLEKKSFTLINGVDGTMVVADADIIDGYNLYNNPEEIDINLVLDGGKSDTVKETIVTLCELRKDCMAILDIPSSDVLNQTGSEAMNVIEYRNSVNFNHNTSYASLYGNWLEVYDKYNRKYRWIPASGFVGGVYAKTDNVSDPWYAPAGLNRAILTGVRRLAWNPDLGERDLLYFNGVNPIVNFTGQGKVIWGQKTLLAKESAFNRVSVRRLFIVIEKAISTAAKWFLFEPNDSITRNLIFNMINPFLQDVQSRRGIYDFRIVIDESINTPERIDRGELWVNIYIKPTRTAEFIVLNFIATKTGANFDELLGVAG